MIFPKILSISSQIYTLPALQDDLTALQHHPYQTQRLENSPSSSYLAKRDDDPVGTVFWDAHGVIKAIFNMDINSEIAQIFERSGTNIARNVMAECERYMLNAPGIVSVYLELSSWAAQLGTYWVKIRRRPKAVISIAIVIQLQAHWSAPVHIESVLEVLQQWFTQGGNAVLVEQVPSARDAGNAPGNQMVDERSIIEEQTLGDRSNSRFCDSPVQNSPFVFTAGTLDTLLKPLITC